MFVGVRGLVRKKEAAIKGWERLIAIRGKPAKGFFSKRVYQPVQVSCERAKTELKPVLNE